jgi:hypothetical protein
MPIGGRNVTESSVTEHRADSQIMRVELKKRKEGEKENQVTV